MVVFSEIKRCQLPHSTQSFQNVKILRPNLGAGGSGLLRWRGVRLGLRRRRVRAVLERGAALARRELRALVERFDRRGIEPFELFTSEFGQNSVKIQYIPRKFKNFRDFEFSTFSNIFAKFLQNFIKLSENFNEKFSKIGK